MSIGTGGLLALQSNVNGQLGHALSSFLLAAIVSFAVGFAFLCLLAATNAEARRGFARGLAALRNRSLSWYTLLAGALGMCYILVQAGTVTALGVAAFSVTVVAGQNVGSVLIDRLSGRRSPLSVSRLGAGALSVGAAAIAAVPSMSRQSPPFGLLLLALVAGFLTAVQLQMNGRVAEASDSPIVAAWTLFGVGLVLLLAIGAASAARGDLPAARLRAVASDSPLLLLGGLLGALFVVVAALVVPKAGVLFFGLSSLAGQLGMGLAIDSIGGRAQGLPLLVLSCLVALAAAWLASPHDWAAVDGVRVAGR